MLSDILKQRTRGGWLRPSGPGPVWCCNSLSPGQVELEGLTGHIEFNSKGQRSNYALKILQFTRNGFRQVSLAPAPPRHRGRHPHCSSRCSQPVSPWHSGRPPALHYPQEQQAAPQARLLAALLPVPAPTFSQWDHGTQPQRDTKKEASCFVVGQGEVAGRGWGVAGVVDVMEGSNA